MENAILRPWHGATGERRSRTGYVPARRVEGRAATAIFTTRGHANLILKTDNKKKTKTKKKPLVPDEERRGKIVFRNIIYK